MGYRATVFYHHWRINQSYHGNKRVASSFSCKDINLLLSPCFILYNQLFFKVPDFYVAMWKQSTTLYWDCRIDSESRVIKHVYHLLIKIWRLVLTISHKSITENPIGFLFTRLPIFALKVSISWYKISSYVYLYTVYCYFETASQIIQKICQINSS